jgi:hypothetical protein
MTGKITTATWPPLSRERIARNDFAMKQRLGDH